MNAFELFGHWAEVRVALIQALDKLDDVQLDFVPREGLWSLRQVLVHISDVEEGWFRFRIEGKYNSWAEIGIEQANYPTVESIKQLLADVHVRTDNYLKTIKVEDLGNVVSLSLIEKTTVNWIIWHVLEHEIHHRGEVFLMLGLLGLEGPDI